MSYLSEHFFLIENVIFKRKFKYLGKDPTNVVLDFYREKF